MYNAKNCLTHTYIYTHTGAIVISSANADLTKLKRSKK